MKYLIFDRDSNPAIDQPTFSVSRSRLELLLGTGRIRMIGKRSAQYVCDVRDPLKTKRPAPFMNCAKIEDKVSWRVKKHHTPDGASLHSGYQLVHDAGTIACPAPRRFTNYHGVRNRVTRVESYA
jgi:hypothetical protein